VELLDSVRSFANNIYPRLRAVLNLRKINRGVLDVKAKQELSALLKEIPTLVCLQLNNFTFLKNKNLTGTTQVEHDLNNFSAGLFGVVELIKENEEAGLKAVAANDLGGVLNDLQLVCEYSPGFIITLEDILLHEQNLESDKENVGQRALDLDFLLAGIRQLVMSGAVDGRVNKLFSSLKFLSSEGILKETEEIVTQPAVIGNFLFNVMRNASKEKTDTKHVNFYILREGDELVIRIVDAGIGMTKEQLDPNSKKFIFGTGKESSGTGSTGIGLADADKRLSKYANSQVRVWSRPRENTEADYNTFPSDNNDEIPVVVMESGEDDSITGLVSTVFELRLPIIQK
jgi:signal transduction histidine kinase